MVKRGGLGCLGGHIVPQNASFKELIEILEPEGHEFYGLRNGFEAFETKEAYKLKAQDIPEYFAGFVGGVGRHTLLKEVEEDGKKRKVVDYEKIDMARNFVKRAKLDYLVFSAGDDHGMQAHILKQELGDIVDVYVLNKTMDNDLGGIDGRDCAPFTDFTSGFHSAVVNALKMVQQHYSGAWTNDCPYLVGCFGRDANWVGIALAYYSFADRLIYGELSKDHVGHSIEEIHRIILESQNENERKYGRRFAMVIVPEGTRVKGLKHVSEDLIDVHGHHNLNPENLVIQLKKELDKEYGMKTQALGITYEMRNFCGLFPETRIDLELGRESARIIAEAIKRGDDGVESVFKIVGDEIKTDLALIGEVSVTRFSRYYEMANRKNFIDYEDFKVTDEIGRYYKPLFGERGELDWLPRKLELVRF